MDRIGDVIRDFPFELPVHRAAWFAALLTPLAKYSYRGPAPMFLIDGNLRAVGQGLLADVIALMLTGRRFPVMSYTNDQEELRKKITTLAVEGEQLVQFDNIIDTLGNDILDMALTAESWKDRILGGNRTFDGPLDVTFYGTGNNIQLRADTPRRICPIRLESGEEQPESRDDLKYPKLRDHVLKHRGELLSAALTILRGWIVAGKPNHGLKPWGSYEPWSDVVPEVVVFAGLPDPGEARKQFQSLADRDAISMEGIIAGLVELDPEGRGKTAAEIVKALKDDVSPSAIIAEMQAAVEELCGKLCGRALGFKFRKFARRNFSGKLIDTAGTAHGKNRWAVFSASARRKPVGAPHSATVARSGCDGGDGGHVSARMENNSAEAPDLDALFQ